jgi:flagellar basal-body rod protein FlgB
MSLVGPTGDVGSDPGFDLTRRNTLLEITDVSMRALEYALNGLELRSDARANNMANVNTPGFRGRQVDFESTLADALRRGTPERAGLPATTPSYALQNGQGNTVDLEGEMTGMIKDNLTRTTLINHYNTKITMLRGVISGR